MLEYQLVVTTNPGRDVPIRLLGMTIPLDIEISEIQIVSHRRDDRLRLFLTVGVERPERLELLIKRLNRLIDVIKVVVAEPDTHRRQSAFLFVRPHVSDFPRVTELARSFEAEVVELSPRGVLLHLSATPARCAAFVEIFDCYNIVDSLTSAATPFRLGLRAVHDHPRLAAVPAVNLSTRKENLCRM